MIETPTLTEADRAAARSIARFCGIRDGDNVILLVDETTHPIVLEAVSGAMAEFGANTTVADVKNPPKSYGHQHNRRFPRAYLPLHHAFRGTDVVIELGVGRFRAGIDAVRIDYGVTYCMPDLHSLDSFRSAYFAYPHDLVALIGEKTQHLMLGGPKEVHVTAPSGTDYRCITDVDKFGVSGSLSDLMCGKLRRPGDWSFFPGGVVGLCALPESPTNGVFVTDYLPPTTCPSALTDPLMRTSSDGPTRWTIEDHWVSRVEGAFADEITELWESAGDKFSRYDGGPMWGIHPKAAPTEANPTDPRISFAAIHSSPQMYHQHLGFKWGLGGSRIAAVVLTPYCFRPTVDVGGVRLVEDGRLTERVLDDEVVEAARAYGDPDEVLTMATDVYHDLFAHLPIMQHGHVATGTAPR